MAWSLLSPFGIQKDAAGTIWHAGRVVDVLCVQDDVLLVGSETGGVWQVSSNGDAVPLSNTWRNEDVSCLAFGPDGMQGAPHVFAGTAGVTKKAGLWVNDPQASSPLSSWIEVPLPPATAKGVNRIVVVSSDRRVIIATEGGLWWAPIPTPRQVRNNPNLYAWNQVTPNQRLPTGRCFGLAEGPNGTIVVSLPGQGLFQGGWSKASTVQMQPADIGGNLNPAAMLETSLDSCAADRGVLLCCCQRRWRQT
jgi:hypothetical protein